MSNFKGAERLEMLGYDIIHLISHGYKENFDTIIEKLEQGSLLEYLLDKYSEELCFISFDTNSPYDPNEWEKVLDEYSYIEFHHNAERKMGIENKEDGLLVLLNIILEIVSNRK